MKENNEINEKVAEIPYIVYESAQIRMERLNKRLIIALMIAIALMFLSNAIWLYSWCQYDYVYEDSGSTVDLDAKDGVANYIGNDGDIVNGTDKSSKEEDKSYPDEETRQTEGYKE